MNQSLLSNFLSKKIFLNLLGVFFVLSILIFGNQIFIVSKESLKIGLETYEIVPFVILKYFGDAPEILSIAMIISYTVVLTKLNKNSEKIIILTGGCNDLDLFKKTLPIFIPILLLLILFLSIFSPWAQKNETNYKNDAKNRPNYVFLKENQFQNFGDLTFYSPKIEQTERGQEIKDIFVYDQRSSNNLNVITSNIAYKIVDPTSGDVFLDLRDGFIYENLNRDTSKKITEFKKYLVTLYEASDTTKQEKSNDYLSYTLL